MKNGLTAVSLALLLGAGVAACGRHVVLDPDTVDDVNDRAWSIKSEPRTNGVVGDGGATVSLPTPVPTQPPGR